jgi:hypothetical protein
MKIWGTCWIMAAVIGFIVTTEFGVRAQTEGLQLVPPEQVPETGTFWLIQMAGPFPCDPSPSLPVYLVEDGSFMVDDSAVIYPPQALTYGMAAMEGDPTPPGEGDEGGSGQSWPGPVDYGCSLWLGLTLSNEVLVLTLNNTRQGQTYSIWSTEDLSVGNWVLETNVLGDVGSVTQTNLPMNQRTNLFLRASEVRDYITNTVFQGLSYSNTRAAIPDTMGAVGPNNFVELLNGTRTNPAIAVYSRAGTLISQTSMTNFFAALGADGTNYPTGNMSDPRLLYDHESHRWVASAIQQEPGIIILAVSNDDDPTNLAAGWRRHVIQIAQSSTEMKPDYDTLGLDANGIYVSVLRGSLGTSIWHTAVAIKKPEIYNGTNFSTLLTNELTSWTIQPAVNYDDVATNGHAWFVATGPPEVGTNYQGGPIMYRRLEWRGTNAVWADTNWIQISNPGPTYQDYFELSGTNVGSFPTSGVTAPQAGTTHRIDLYSVGSRLMMAVVRKGFLWTCHTVGVSETNGTYTGDSSGSTVDRSAIQWLTMQISPDHTTLTLGDHGRLFDSAPSNAWWYYFPSLALNCPGDMVVGFSGSSNTNYIGAFYAWRLANGLVSDSPRLLQGGEIGVTAGVSDVRWGDYSATTVDPSDDWSFWTVQEYAAGSTAFYWKTEIVRIRPTP